MEKKKGMKNLVLIVYFFSVIAITVSSFYLGLSQNHFYNLCHFAYFCGENFGYVFELEGLIHQSFHWDAVKYDALDKTARLLDFLLTYYIQTNPDLRFLPSEEILYILLSGNVAKDIPAGSLLNDLIAAQQQLVELAAEMEFCDEQLLDLHMKREAIITKYIEGGNNNPEAYEAQKLVFQNYLNSCKQNPNGCPQLDVHQYMCQRLFKK